LEEYQQRLDNLSNETGVSNEVVAEYEAKIKELVEQLEKTNEVSNDYAAIIEEKNAIIEEQGRRLSKVKLEKTDKEIEFIKLAEQLEDYKNEIEKLNNAKNNYMVEANKSLEEAEKLTIKLSKIEGELKTKLEKESQLAETIEAQKEKIFELQNEIEEIQIKSKIANHPLPNLEETEPIQEFDDQSNFDTPPNDMLSSESNTFTEDEVNDFNLTSDPFSPVTNELNSEMETETHTENEEFNELETDNLHEPEEHVQGKSAIYNDLEETDNSNLPAFSEFAHLLYGNISVVSVNVPRATMDIASKFKDYLTALIESESTKIVIDLSETEFVDSTVLGVLVSSLKKAMSRDGDVRIVWGDNTESSMFYITRMDKVFKLFDNLEDAIQSYL